MNTNANTDTPKEGRHGGCYNKNELRKNFKEIIDQILGNFDFQLQELQYELDTNNEEIDTEEIRGILKSIEYLCEDLDDLENKNKK